MVSQDVAAAAYAQRPWTGHYEPGVPTEVQVPAQTLPEMLIEQGDRHPERPAIVFFDRVITYRELERATARFAAALAGLGVRPGDRVALLLPNTPQFVIGYYGALRAGAIVVASNPLYVAAELEHQLRDSGAKVILTLSKFYPTVATVRARTALEHVIVTNIKEYFPRRLRILFTLARERKEGHRARLPDDGHTHRLPDLLSGAPAEPPAYRADPEEVALLQYTGGTTGTAKGAMLTHRNLLANLCMMESWQADLAAPMRGYSVILGVLPLFHAYGMATVMNAAIRGGGTMILLPRFEAPAVLKAIQRHQPNLFPGVPTIYATLTDRPGVEKYDLRSISVCLSGAAPLPAEVKRRFEALTGAHLVEGYGLSEASPVTHSNPLRQGQRSGSVGLPFPGTEAKVVDLEDRTRNLPPGEAGELAVRGPQVMKGYWNRPEETAAVLEEGWLYTGDVAQMDEDGYFYIVDRKKDMIISGGFNVYPREVEEPLYAHPKVREAVAVGVPDARWGEQVKVYVVLKEGETATAQEIIDYCRRHMAAYKAPKTVEFRSELPKTLIGKVLRRALREEEAGDVRVPASNGDEAR
jgi:long-chain acyl-CoA synthetase